jgi:hypothetical protein
MAWDVATVPITINANGNENTVTFSLQFDPFRLSYSHATLGSGAAGGVVLVNSSQLPNGNLGLSLALPDGVSFTAGMQEALRVSFVAGILTNGGFAAISFTNTPAPQRIANSADLTLPSTYTNGGINILAAEYEGDVSPRPGGNRTVTINDWLLVGRYVARLDFPTNAAEFQRADCAPRATRGDGVIRVSDWTQVGRYISAAFDPLTPLGGTNSETMIPGPGPSASRILSFDQSTLLPGQPLTISVMLTAQGNENAVGFSLNFNPAQATFTSAVLGTDAGGAVLNVNSSQAASGRVGLALALNPGSSFIAGAREVVRLNFAGAPSFSGVFQLAYGDLPVPREIADVTAVALPALYVSGTVTNYPGPILQIARTGQNALLSWTPWATNFMLQQSEDLRSSGSIWSNVPVAPGQTSIAVPLSLTNRFYRLSSP